MTNHAQPAAEPPYRWVIVASGATMTCVAIGSLFALAVFLQPMAQDTGWSRAGISSAMTFAFLGMGLAGFGWGALSDRIGPKPVVLIGTVLLGLANVLASRATSLVEFQALYGVLMGVAASTFFAPVISATASWFERRRSLAVSLVSAGMGVAPLTISPVAAWLVTQYDWRTAQMTIGIGAWVLLLPAALAMRAAPAARTAAGAAAASRPVGPTAWQALRSRTFVVLALTYFLCCATHAGPIFHTVSYAYGGVMPLYAVLASEQFGPRVLGTVLGASGVLSSVGMALGPAIGGWLFDHYGSYAGMYIGALAIALGAALIGSTFPRPPRAPAAVPAAA